MLKHVRIVGLTLIVVVAAAFGVSAQADLAAQIENFWRSLSNGGFSFNTLSIITNGYANFGTVLGTNGYGFRDVNGSLQFKNSGGNWATFAGGGGNAAATYWVATTDGTLPNAKVLGSLGTGLVLNTTTTGVPSAYAGTSCTNQFPRSLNASGAATCSSVSLATDVTGALAAVSFPALTGDITTPGGSLATTLGTTGVGAGSVGSATSIPTFTVDAKGRLTAKGSATPQLTLTNTYFSSLAATNLTGIPGANVTGTLATAAFPALTGDVTNTVGTLATTVGKIGGKTVTLGGNLTTSGAFALTMTLTNTTTVTLPTTGTLVSTTVTALSSLVTVGTITGGTWNATPVTPQYGGTGLATITAHAVMVGEGTSTVVAVAGGTNCVLAWSLSSVDPTCSATPTITGLIANTAGAGTLGSAAKPFASLIVGTAATNNLTVTPAAFGQATTATVDDPVLAAVKLPIVSRGTITFTSGAVTNGTCSTPVTVTVTGLTTTAVVVASLNSALQANWKTGVTFHVYPTANTVNLTVCNPTAGSITPETQTLNYAAIVP